MRSEVTRLASKLARSLKYAAEGGSVTPDERAALDRVIKWAAIVPTRELVPQCEGETDPESQAPACNETDVRRVIFDPESSAPLGKNLCPKHRALVVVPFTVGEALPPVITEWPCANFGCRRIVRRKGDFCSPSCVRDRYCEDFPSRAASRFSERD